MPGLHVSTMDARTARVRRKLPYAVPRPSDAEKSMRFLLDEDVNPAATRMC
jgi:hypothetical protein